MPSIEENILSRAPTAAHLQSAKRAVERVLEFSKAVRAKHDQTAKDQRLTPLGRQDELRKFVGEHAHEVIRNRKTVETIRAKAAERRAKVAPPPPDKTDFAAAIVRSDLRRMLLDLPAGKRLAAVLAGDADPMLQQAVIEAPDAASGITPQAREIITGILIERAHPGALAAIEEIESAIEVVEVAGRVAANTAGAAAGFPDPTSFDRFITESVGDSRRLESEIDREFAPLAEIE